LFFSRTPWQGAYAESFSALLSLERKIDSNAAFNEMTLLTKTFGLPPVMREQMPDGHHAWRRPDVIRRSTNG
jgi:hypothetical protein